MTVREATQSIISLTGGLNICGCSAGSSGFSLATASIMALNRAMQTVWLAPNARQMAREPVEVVFAGANPGSVDLDADVLHVVGPAIWKGYQPLHLAANKSDFNSYHLNYGEELAQGDLYDTIEIADFHDVSNGTPFWGIQLHLPLWDDRAVLVWFDDAAGSHTIDLEAATTAGSQLINRETISVRVVLPAVDTDSDVVTPLIVAAINRQAGQFLTAELLTGTKVRVYRRRPADLGVWNLYNPLSINFVVTAGPRFPAVAWAEEINTATGDDPTKIRLHIKPSAAGTVSLDVIKEPPKYTMDDLDCDGDGTASTVIRISHQFAESVLLPLARLYFAQDASSFLTQQTAAMMPALEGAAESARVALGLAQPGVSQHSQSTQSTDHAHS